MAGNSEPGISRIDSMEDSCRETERSRPGCYQFFGIKSHLHHFYEYEGGKPSADDESTHFLLQPKKSKRCSPVLWKIILWFGINSLIFGAILILVSHFTPRKETLHSTGRFALLDKRASRLNAALDILGTVGVVSFCIAGILIIIAVILPTYFNEYCFEDRHVKPQLEEVLSAYSDDTSCPIERTVPLTQLIHGVQPKRKVSESGIVDTHYEPIE